ncbi:TIGR02757 family protein [Helicobacter equorum]|uniref:TIGR02757 family protein n=1 Tax=Helicobacter equorum TaxID=361872 RepID=A0A3D8ITE4_9HELI|nr:TIGR02757 family protein [Helicobacter equorum]RDU68293.1 TIGR02757 family protein [Helicobacter equorum]
MPQKPCLTQYVKNTTKLQRFLDSHYEDCNTLENLSTPDPIVVVRRYTQHPYFAEIALLCALLSYGSAKQIVTFLHTLDFGLLEHTGAQTHKMPYYRFQNAQDIQALFAILRECIRRGGIREIFARGAESGYTPYRILNAIYHSIETLREIALNLGVSSRGVDFAIGAELPKDISFGKYEDSQTPTSLFNPKGKSPLKRWNLFARWLVRDDALDFGIWQDIITPSELIIPLDTHTFAIGQKLGLLKRKTYDLAAALELTQSLQKYCPDDPVRYDFALYRIGQSRAI